VSPRAALAAVLVAAAAVALAGPRLGGADPAVVVADERGRELASVPCPRTTGSPSPTGTRSTRPR
jgi:hypothetical protein